MHGRIEQLQRRLNEQNVDFAVINNPTDVYYFAGTGTQSTLIVPVDDEPILLVRINYERAKGDAWVDEIRQSRGRHSVVDALSEHGEPPTVGMALDTVPAQLVDGLEEACEFNIEIVNLSTEILDVRKYKDENEIGSIEQAAEISKNCLTAVPDIIEPGITEGELQAELEKIKRRNGAEPEMVNRGWNMWNNFGIVASGPNTAEVSGFWITITGSGMHNGRPFGASTREIRENDVFIIDHGTLVNGYHSDEARTYVVGDGREEVQRDVEILFEALNAAKRAIEPGVSASAPFERAREVAEEYDREEEFMALGQYGVEYVGHCVGLEIDERPLIASYSDETLEPGMTIALEPKFIYPGQWGATVEDTVLVTDDGSRTLTSSPRKLLRC